MAFKNPRKLYETAFDSKVEKTSSETGDLFNRITSHPILQILNLKKYAKNSSPRKLCQSKSFASSPKMGQCFQKESKGLSSRFVQKRSTKQNRLRPIGLSKSDDEILNRAFDSAEEEDYLEDYVEGSHAKDLVKDLQSLHMVTDGTFNKSTSNQEIEKSVSAHSSPHIGRPKSFSRHCKIQPKVHPRVKLLQGEMSKSQALPSNEVLRPYKLQSPPGTAPLPLKFSKNKFPPSWLNKDVCKFSDSSHSIDSMEVLASCSQKEYPSVRVHFSSTDSVDSIESLRSSISDGNKSFSNESTISSLKGSGSDSSLAKPFLNLTNPPKSILQSAKFQILSPISDKSQEPSCDFDQNSPLERAPLTPKNISEGFRNIHHILPGPTQISEGFRNIHHILPGPTHPDLKGAGSDSGISTEQRHASDVEQVNYEDLPFDMPKLRRKLAARKSNISNSFSSISSSATSAEARRSLPPVGFSSLNPTITKLQNASDMSRASSSNSSEWEVHSSESSEDQGTPSRKACLALQLGCAAMSVRGEPVDVSLPTAKQSWYHGGINRKEAETLLRSQYEGSYLVRAINSSKNEYSLALKSARGYMHLRIHFKCETGQYTIGRSDQQFPTVAHIINHYTTFRIPIKGAEHMVLVHPIPIESL